MEEDAYLKGLAEVPRQGYALDDEEYLAGIKALAVYLGTLRGLFLLIRVVGFSDAMNGERMPRIVEESLDAANQLRSVIDTRK